MSRMTLAKVLLRQEKEFLVEENFYKDLYGGENPYKDLINLK